ncbi:MAG: hypothetical protein LBV43_14355 [Prevotella sp.]|jgi:hypothetical protein|nr:hypothetical protein [Prevotella sp.]
MIDILGIKDLKIYKYIKGTVFAILLITSFSSCCVTGYCQINQQTEEKINKTGK